MSDEISCSRRRLIKREMGAGRSRYAARNRRLPLNSAVSHAAAHCMVVILRRVKGATNATDEIDCTAAREKQTDSLDRYRRCYGHRVGRLAQGKCVWRGIGLPVERKTPRASYTHALAPAAGRIARRPQLAAARLLSRSSTYDRHSA